MYISPLIMAARVWKLSPLQRAAVVLDSEWDESKHPRKSNGQFGAGCSASKSPLRRAAEVVKPKRKSRKSSRITSAERERVTHEISTWFHGRFDGLHKSSIAVGNYVYLFTINEYGDYDIYSKILLK